MEQMHEEKVIEAERKFAADVAAKKQKDPKYDAESDKVRSLLAGYLLYWYNKYAADAAEKKKMNPKYDALLDEVRSFYLLYYAVYLLC